jgi:hypothetical protein
MAAKQTSAVAPSTRNIDELIDRLYANPTTGSSSSGIIRKTFEVVGDTIADSGDLLAELRAGLSAGRRNYAVQKEIAIDRQKARTRERLSRLLEQ